jgi:hypothetical protein
MEAPKDCPAAAKLFPLASIELRKQHCYGGTHGQVLQEKDAAGFERKCDESHHGEVQEGLLSSLVLHALTELVHLLLG